MLKLKHSGQGELIYATKESAGFDICANEDLTLPAGEWKLVATGLFITEGITNAQVIFGAGLSLPVLPELQIRPRSGLAVKHGVTVLNSPSTIDCDYRGEIKVPLMNHGKLAFEIRKGDRIAQGICAMILQLPGVKVLSNERGSGGFGSTGV